MRAFIILSVVAVVATPVDVAAEVSGDLVFCSRLGNSRERIACYDAAARIAERSMTRGRSTAPPAAPPVLVKASVAGGAAVVAVAPAERAAPFSGPYAAVGGAFGFARPRPFSISDVAGALEGDAHASGLSGLVVAGANLQSGGLVAGIEASFRYGREHFSDEKTDTVVPFGGVTGTSTKSYEITSDMSAHLAGRIGLAIDDTLIYAKAGIGAAHLAEQSRIVAAGGRCAFTIGGVCGQVDPLRSLSSSAAAWVPSILLGAGIEQNFGGFFARAGAEAEGAAFTGTSRFGFTTQDTYWTARALAMVGLRF